MRYKLFAAGVLWPASSFACGIEGKATRTDGSKVDGTARVSTSWNSNTAYPRGGYYNLELGQSACGKNVEVYVNGYRAILRLPPGHSWRQLAQ